MFITFNLDLIQDKKERTFKRNDMFKDKMAFKFK